MDGLDVKPKFTSAYDAAERREKGQASFLLSRSWSDGFRLGGTHHRRCMLAAATPMLLREPFLC
jgi:hypothetical protein